MEKLYKWLDRDDTAHGLAWPIPAENDDGTWTPGEWVDVSDRGPVEGCTNTALHACRVQDIAQWVKSGDLFEIEFDGETIMHQDEKVCGQKARLVRRFPCGDRIKRLWACDMAESVLELFERKRPNDMRPRNAIDVARRHANGTASADEMAAAWDAARGASRAAARAAAWYAAWGAAWGAARAAAWDAERDAERDAARAAANMRHGQMLLDLLEVE